jgi:hypothetical protein
MVAEVNIVLLVLYGIVAAYGVAQFIKIRNERDDLKKICATQSQSIKHWMDISTELADKVHNKESESRELRIEATKLADLTGKLMEDYKCMKDQLEKYNSQEKE